MCSIILLLNTNLLDFLVDNFLPLKFSNNCHLQNSFTQKDFINKHIFHKKYLPLQSILIINASDKL